MIALVILLLFLPTVIADTCEVKILEKSCFNNYVLIKSQLSDCSIQWRIGSFCPYGCKYGECLSENVLPVILLQEKYIIDEEHPFIIFSIKNEGTRGDIKLSVEGNASQWIEIPSTITLEPNETKEIVGIVKAHGLKGVYSFTIHAKNSMDYYASSLLVFNPSTPHAFTGTYGEVNVYLGAVLAIFMVCIAVYLTRRKRVKEESF